jgi:hypothetical protein
MSPIATCSSPRESLQPIILSKLLYENLNIIFNALISKKLPFKTN